MLDRKFDAASVTHARRTPASAKPKTPNKSKWLVQADTTQTHSPPATGSNTTILAVTTVLSAILKINHTGNDAF